MKKHYEDKIKLFTSLIGSLTVLGANNADAQTIVVRDINPDAIINISGSDYSLDIDNNGTVDFKISPRTYSYDGSTNKSFYFIGTGYIGNNQPFAGTSNSHTFVSQNGRDYYVDRLSVGDTTSFITEYNDYNHTRLFEVYNGVLRDDYRWVAGTTDKYVGVQFTIGNNVHFGWVKLSIAGDYNSVTVKEVGYESAPGALMKAGAMVSANKATGLAVIDNANNGNASDIEVSFTKASSEANISGYRVYVVPTTEVNTFTLYKAQNVLKGRYTFIAKTGSNISQNLPASLLDVNGAAIVAGTGYTVLVLSVGDNSTGDALTSSGAAITISTTTGASEASEKIAANIYAEGSTLYFNDMQHSGQVQVLNAAGAELYSGSIQSGNSSIDLSNAAIGIYTIRLVTDGMNVGKNVYLIK